MQSYKSNEQEKKRAYEERVREVEHGSFAPLVFSISGGMGPIATTCTKEWPNANPVFKNNRKT